MQPKILSNSSISKSASLSKSSILTKSIINKFEVKTGAIENQNGNLKKYSHNSSPLVAVKNGFELDSLAARDRYNIDRKKDVNKGIQIYIYIYLIYLVLNSFLSFIFHTNCT
jgi:hypothetical protein